MRIAILLSFPAVLLLAQPTISPSAVTLTPGAVQQFTTNAKTPYWNIGGNGSIELRTGKYTAPSTLTPTGATVRVTDLSTGLHADAVVTLVASLPGQPSTACPCSGDVFVLSSSPAVTATFTRAPDGTWTAPAAIVGPFLALVQVYRNGLAVQKNDIASIIYSNGKIVLTTNDTWIADLVSATWVTVNK